MKFISLRPKLAYQQNKLDGPSSPTLEDVTKASGASHQIQTYTELRQQIHHDLRIQHPEWIEPGGKSPMCDFYEARLMDLLGADAMGLN